MAHPLPQKRTPPDRWKVRGRKNESAGQRSQSKFIKHKREGKANSGHTTAAPGEIVYCLWEPAAKVAASNGRSIDELRESGLTITDGMILEADFRFWCAERGEFCEAHLAHARDEGA